MEEKKAYKQKLMGLKVMHPKKQDVEKDGREGSRMFKIAKNYDWGSGGAMPRK